MVAPGLRLSFRGLPAAFRRGIEHAAGDAGLLADGGVDVSIVVLDGPNGTCQVIDELMTAGPVLLLLEVIDSTTIAHAAAHGACFADLNAEPELIAKAAAAAVDGVSLVTADLLASIAGPGPHGAVTLSREEAEWLMELAGGATVVKLADDFGYSERGMFRRLHDVYTRLGAANRAEALVTAQRHGLLRRDRAD